jgi:endoglucanase
MQMLKVDKGRIVDAGGNEIFLRGFAVGGWMNTENFINGYPGFEQGLRAAVANDLGAGKAEFLFDRMLDHFLSEDDIRFMKECGATVVRLPLNYRHFENDAKPFEYIEKGFRRLDKALGWCAKHGLYVILDLHACQGWQNPDWHSDNPGRVSLIWGQPHFQERFIRLWEEFAGRYAGNGTIAGYNVMNEPVTAAPHGFFGFKYRPDWDAMNSLYRRVVKAIRRKDPRHIIFLEGDAYSVLFSGLDKPFADNLVYSNHQYIASGFGPGKYPGKFGGEHWDANKLKQLATGSEGYKFTKKHKVPLWVGEFGSTFNGRKDEIGYRLQSVDDQLGAMNAADLHWTIWTYKDIGVMGTALVDPRSEYMRTIEPVLKAKTEFAVDAWLSFLPPTKARTMTNKLGELIMKKSPDTGAHPARFQYFFRQAVLSGYVGNFLQPAWAQCFAGMSEKRIDRVMESFALRKCGINADLAEAMVRCLKSRD